jgi:hypothetical protein
MLQAVFLRYKHCSHAGRKIKIQPLLVDRKHRLGARDAPNCCRLLNSFMFFCVFGVSALQSKLGSQI